MGGVSGQRDLEHEASVEQLGERLIVAKARIQLCWSGEYSSVGEVRARTRGAPIHDLMTFWAGRPKYGYAAVASLQHEAWVEPFWAGPRTYGYEWVVMDSEKKTRTWFEDKPPPRGGAPPVLTPGPAQDRIGGEAPAIVVGWKRARPRPICRAYDGRMR